MSQQSLTRFFGAPKPAEKAKSTSTPSGGEKGNDARSKSGAAVNATVRSRASAARVRADAFAALFSASCLLTFVAYALCAARSITHSPSILRLPPPLPVLTPH
eukprot:3975491-Pleurochrysis_carterae.AAC.2